MPILGILAIIALGAGALAALTVATFVLGGLLSVAIAAGFVFLGTGGDSVLLLFGVLAVLVLFYGVRVMVKVVHGEAPFTAQAGHAAVETVDGAKKRGPARARSAIVGQVVAGGMKA